MFAAAAGFLGCAQYRAPHLDVARIRLAEETPDGLVLNFALDARNDNPVELPLREVRYIVHLDGEQVFSGVRSPEANLRRLGTQRITVPAAIAIDGRERPAGLVRYAIEGELRYTTPGDIARILFDLHIHRPRIRFKDEGVIDLGEAAQTAASSSR
jgi:hypothetical protein